MGQKRGKLRGVIDNSSPESTIICYQISADSPYGFPPSSHCSPQLATALGLSRVSVSASQGPSGSCRFVRALVPRGTLIVWVTGPSDCVVRFILCPLVGLLVYGHGPFLFMPKGPSYLCLLCLRALSLRLRALSFMPTGHVLLLLFTRCIVTSPHDMLPYFPKIQLDILVLSKIPYFWTVSKSIPH